ncbi:MAG: type IV secretion system DNA-binding domain-containing protein [bacterium]|nr:type IV secretion system DNA-binding domain-containing protein [bacterium]
MTLVFLLLIALFLILVLFVVRSAMLRAGLVSRALNLQLFAVRFTPVAPEKEMNVQQIREKISLMEQMFSYLYQISDNWFATLMYGRPIFALELTIPSVGEEISFYVAVPRRFVGSVEKIIQGIFPEAHIEESRDYNIFNPEGAAVASCISFNKGRFYPIRTYQKIEGDPIKTMTNVFTQLAIAGEGAALQIIARPASKSWIGKLRMEAHKVSEGKAGQSETVRFIGELVQSKTPEQIQAEQQKKFQRKMSPIEEDMVKQLEGKASKPLFETNIRLMASAPTLQRSQDILQGLEVSLAQFNDPSLNSFRVDRVGGNSLKNAVFNFSFRSFDESKKMVMSSEELTSIFHFPNVPIETPHLKSTRAREASAPANLPTQGILMGYNMFRGQKADIRMQDEDRRRHLYTIGQTGTGKSVFLKNLIIQDIQAGKGVCVIDPHGDMVEDILQFVPRQRSQDVVYFNPGDIERPMGLNMLEYDPNYPEQKTFIVNELLSIFDKLYNMSVAGGPMFEQYFRNATLLTMEDPASGNTMLEIERVLTDKVFRDYKLSKTSNIVVKNFWTQIAEKAGGDASLKDMVPYIASKFDNFIANEIMRPIIAQQKSAFNFREIMDSQKILLVNLSKGRLGDINSSLIGLIIVGKLLMAALSRTDMPEEKRKDFYLYIDEFQNVTTDSIATILSEARKYRLDLVITHQFIGQLKEEIKKAVFGNVGSVINFRIGSDDAEFMAKQFKPVFAEADLLNLDNYNCYVKLLINGATSTPFSMKTLPPTKGDKEIAEIIKEISRTKYGRPRDEIEREIIASHSRQFE